MKLVRFYEFVVKIAIALAIAGQLKSCTLSLLGLSAKKNATGMMSYASYTKLLTTGSEQKPEPP